MRAEKDLHKNDVGDLILRCQSRELKSVVYLQVIPKFSVILCGSDQLEILGEELQKGPVRLFLDATGNVTRKVKDSELLHHVLALTLKRDGRNDLLLPIAEMVTDDSTSLNISFFLKTVRDKVCITVYCKEYLCISLYFEGVERFQNEKNL